ncbi:MAG TPA: TIGR02449 family protein, partial [Gammaproteobacteria bacterium]|nr:TIGR02449 family protein [Gammaproteobacteria bacterium]
LMTERAHLIQKNELARNRLEGIVSRLKDMEEGSV